MVANKDVNFYKLIKNNNRYELKVLHKYFLSNNKYNEHNGIYIMQKGYNLGLFDTENVFLISTNQTYINGIINIAQGNRNHTDIYTSDVIYYLSCVKATGFTMYHNHPNNLIYPSDDDHISRECMNNIAKSMGITFYGSYILGEKSYCEVENSIKQYYRFNYK